MKKSEEYNIFKCITCNNKVEYSFEEMRTHLEKVHKINVKKTKATKEMVMHMDGKDWYASEYIIEIGSVKLKNETCNKRDKEGQKYWR